VATPKNICNALARAGRHNNPDLYKLAGEVTVDSSAAIRRVLAYHRETGEYVGSTMSANTGVWEITGIPQYGSQNIMVIAQDTEAGARNAGIRDFVTPVLMTTTTTTTTTTTSTTV